MPTHSSADGAADSALTAAPLVRHVVLAPQVADIAYGDGDLAEGRFVGGRLADGGDLAQITGGAGRVVLLSRASDRADAQADLDAARRREPGPDPAVVCALGGGPTCYPVVKGVLGDPVGVTLIPRTVDVFERTRGIFETDVLSGKSVAVLGLGSGGSTIARELAMCGVGRFVLLDHDRLEVGNVCRHQCGLPDVGRLKVNAVADLISQRNPAADLTLVEERIHGGNTEAVAQILRDAQVDLVIGATDNRESRLLVNRMCLLNGWTGIFAGVFRRAYGGQVLRVVPDLGPCYQCFVSALPILDEDREVSTTAAAAAVAYADRPVAVEPGLFSDIAPVALMVVKLAILELLTAPTTLDPLRHDLVAPLYLWLNRREWGTQYADLPPMETGVGEMSVLRWYGVDLPKRPSCSACGASPLQVSESAAELFPG